MWSFLWRFSRPCTPFMESIFPNDRSLFHQDNSCDLTCWPLTPVTSSALAMISLMYLHVCCMSNPTSICPPSFLSSPPLPAGHQQEPPPINNCVLLHSKNSLEMLEGAQVWGVVLASNFPICQSSGASVGCAWWTGPIRAVGSKTLLLCILLLPSSANAAAKCLILYA